MLLHPPFDIVKGIVVDYMHTVLLGVVPALLNLWLSKENKDRTIFYRKQGKLSFIRF